MSMFPRRSPTDGSLAATDRVRSDPVGATLAERAEFGPYGT